MDTNNKHKFVVLNKGVLEEYTEYEEIPEEFDNLISFEPVVPEEEKDQDNLNFIPGLQTAEICHIWHQKFVELKKRETH